MDQTTPRPARYQSAPTGILLLIAGGLIAWGTVHMVGVWRGGAEVAANSRRSAPYSMNSEPTGAKQIADQPEAVKSFPLNGANAGGNAWGVWRGLMVIGCMGVFLGIWFVLLKTRRPRAAKYRVPSNEYDTSNVDTDTTASRE